MSSMQQARPLRVVLASAGLGSGGAERQFCYTARGLCDCREVGDLTLACQDISSPGADFYLPLVRALERGTIVECPAIAADLGLVLPYALTDMAAILPNSTIAEFHAFLRLFRKAQPDVVQCWQDQINVTAGLAAVAAGVPRIILNCRNSSPPAFSYYQPYFWPAYRFLLRHHQICIMANSYSGAMDYAHWLDIPADRFRVVGNAFLPDTYDNASATPEAASTLRGRLGIPENARIVGSIFRFGDEKHPFLWLEVAKKIATVHPEIHFAIFGDGVLRPAFETAATAALGNRLHLPGHTPNALAALSIMDLFLLTSRREGMPNVLLESQWMGVPVVATDVGGVRETLISGGGEAVASSDSSDLAAACERVLAGPRLERTALRAHISDRFSSDSMIAATLRAFTEPPPDMHEMAISIETGPQPTFVPSAMSDALSHIAASVPCYHPIDGNVLALLGFSSLRRNGVAAIEKLKTIAQNSNGRIHVLLGPDAKVESVARNRLGSLSNVSLQHCSLANAATFEREEVSAILPPSVRVALSTRPDAGTITVICLAIIKTRAQRLCSFSSSLFTSSGEAGLICGVPIIEIVPPPPEQMLLSRASIRRLTASLLHQPAIRCIHLPIEPAFPIRLVARFGAKIRQAILAAVRRPPSIHRPQSETLVGRLRNWSFCAQSAIMELLYIVSLRPIFRLTLRTSITADDDGLLFVIGSLGPGGAERQAVLTLSGLTARGQKRASIACQHLSTPYERFFLPNLEMAGIPVRVVGTADSIPTQRGGDIAIARRLPLSLWEIATFLLTIEQQRPKIVHLWLDDINVKAGLAALLLGVPCIVLSLRSLPPTHFLFWQPYMRPIYRHLAKSPNVVLVNNSIAGARTYERWLGLPEGRIRVIQNGFDFETLNAQDIKALRQGYRQKLPNFFTGDAPIMGTVFRLTEEKRPFLWLEIAAEVYRKMPTARFLLVGDGPLRDGVKQAASRLGLADVIHMTGQEQHPMAAMAAMDIFLLTSRVEGLPNVLIEAQALGIPVVTTPVGGAPETLENGRTGWVLEDISPVSAAEIIVSLFNDSAWRRQAAKIAPVLARQRFDMSRMLDETQTLYDGFQ